MSFTFLVIATSTCMCLGEIILPKGENGVRDVTKDPDYYRLPKGLTPESYNIRLIPNLSDGSFNFKGEVSIEISVQKAKDTITLHSRNLKITEEKLIDNESPNADIGILSAAQDKERDFHVLILAKELTVGRNYMISMKFEGVLNDDLDGFYKSSYYDINGNLQWMAVTHFEATRAREAFPCFDEPHLKAKFTVSIARNRRMNTLSNMDTNGPPEEDPNLPESYVWDHYKESSKMSTYLVAFIVSTFKSKKAGNSGFRVWAREDAIDEVDYSLKIGPKVLDVMRGFTNIEYSLPKMDMIAIPDFRSGAMENWGLVTFRETSLLYKNGISTASNQERVAKTIAHELSHQWFGNLVTPEWWKFIWLNEGFARYFEYAAMDMIEPTWRLMEQFVVEQVQTAFFIDSLDSNHPITFEVRTPVDIDSVFDEIIYNKAASVIRMMEHFLTRNTFRFGLQQYLSNRRYSTGNDILLFEALDSQAKHDGVLPDYIYVKEIMKTWTNQIGYPVITVERMYENGEAIIKQERFVLQDIGKSETLSWWIPITFTTQYSLDFNNTVPSHWMTESDKSIVIEGLPKTNNWIIFNIQESGYYRVNYDEKNWMLITNYLNSVEYDKIHPVNRAQLLDDSLSLARGGYLNYNLALDLLSYLARETDFIPWHSAYQALDFLDTRMAKSKEQKKFTSYVLHLLNTYYEKVKFEESSDDNHILKLSRSKLLSLACKYNHKNCVSEANKYFSDWKEGKINTVPANLKSVIYCIGISTGSIDKWSFLLKAYTSTTVATERALLMTALGCTKDVELLQWYLNETISDCSAIRKQDRASILAAVYSQPNGLDIVIDFTVSNFKKINEKYAKKSFGSIIKGISKRISSEEQAAKIKDFLKINEGSFGPSEREVKQAMQTTDDNMRWNKKYIPVIEQWLREKFQPQ